MKDSYKLKIKFQGLDWKEYNFILNDFSITEILHKDLKPADASCQVSLLPNIELNNLLLGMGEFDVQAQIIKNNKIFFTGYLKKNFTIPKAQKLQPVKLEIVSGGYLLKQKVGRDVFIKTKKTVTATLKEILDLAGINYNSIPQINDTLYGVHLKPADSYHKILTDILFEYGYSFIFNQEGKIDFINLFLQNPQSEHLITGKECLDLISLNHDERKKTEVSTEWAGVEIVEDSYAFKETAGAQMGYSCFIELLPATYYRGAQDGIYIPYQSNQGEVIFAENVTLEIEGDMSNIAVQKFEPLNTKAFIKIKNTDNLFSNWIRKLNFKAEKVYVKKTKNKSKAANNTTNDKRLNIQAKYIYTKVRADILSKDLLNYYNLSNITYKFKTIKDYKLGAVVSIQDRNIGTGLVRILEKKINVLENYIEYAAETVGAYSPPTETESEIEAEPNPPQDGKEGKPGKDGKPGKGAFFPKENKKIALFNFDESKKTISIPDPYFTAWQSKIIEYDCTDKQEIKMTFEEALNNVIILSGELKNDFKLKLFFNKQNGNGAKQYLIVYKLTGNFNVTIGTEEAGTNKISQNINTETYGLGCYAVVDFRGNVWAFEGNIKQSLIDEILQNTENTLNNTALQTITNFQNEVNSFFITEKNKMLLFIQEKTNELENAHKDRLIKESGPIGEIRYFTGKKFVYGYLYANGYSFIPELYPEFYQFWLENFGNKNKKNYLGYDAFGYPKLPDLRGVALRAVDDGSGRGGADLALEYQGDAIRNIKGRVGVQGNDGYPNVTTGVFQTLDTGYIDSGTSQSSSYLRLLGFNASKVVPTAEDNRVKSYGVYPFIKVI
ncbi:hypothetical protein E4O04_08890 [Treponema sp. OMZ 799]|uniref:hypothetical protein n=1 Tax=Treponema sp. OMZ 799 TaxID=2563668 RepID=UPI0020A32AEF|nr:hypothetical protein [Treponema sp. OMZ 799]UTC78107.1 hypothetical protein E4O04_08890 [Treponema sp. OMZ 799]